MSVILYTIFGLMIVTATFSGLIFVVMNRRYALEAAKHGEAVPLFRYLVTELMGTLRHPHEWAAEMDSLMSAALLEPETRMPDDRFERFMVLLAERVKSKETDLRKWEREKAAILILALPIARDEERSPVDLEGLRLVFSKPPTKQTAEDRHESHV